MTKGKLLEAKIMELWFHHDSIMQVSGSHRGSSHLCIVMMLQLIPNSGITPIIGCLLKGLLNPKTSFYKSSAVAKKVNGGGKKRPHWREYAILYALLGALLDLLRHQQQKRMLIILVQQPAVPTKMANTRNAV